MNVEYLHSAVNARVGSCGLDAIIGHLSVDQFAAAQDGPRIMRSVQSCLVTGADGFIGRVLCRQLDRTANQVYRVVHLGAGPDAIPADLGREPIGWFDEMHPDTVFHLAGRVHEFDNRPDSETEHLRVTVEGTRQLLAASLAAGVQTFVFFSTCAVMPIGLAGPLDESVEPRPNTPYARAKLIAENLVIEMNGTGGLKTVCLRLPTVYGPGHKGQLARMIQAIERGWFPPIPDLGGRRSLVHVDDVVGAALLVAGTPESAGKVYIVAEPRAYTARELYEIVLKSLGRRPPNWQLPRIALSAAAHLGDLGERITGRGLPFDSAALLRLSQSALYSGARIDRELGFKPTRSFATSAQELASWRSQ